MSCILCITHYWPATYCDHGHWTVTIKRESSKMDKSANVYNHISITCMSSWWYLHMQPSLSLPAVYSHKGNPSCHHHLCAVTKAIIPVSSHCVQSQRQSFLSVPAVYNSQRQSFLSVSAVYCHKDNPSCQFPVCTVTKAILLVSSWCVHSQRQSFLSVSTMYSQKGNPSCQFPLCTVTKAILPVSASWVQLLGHPFLSVTIECSYQDNPSCQACCVQSLGQPFLSVSAVCSH